MSETRLHVRSCGTALTTKRLVFYLTPAGHASRRLDCTVAEITVPALTILAVIETARLAVKTASQKYANICFDTVLKCEATSMSILSLMWPEMIYACVYRNISQRTI